MAVFSTNQNRQLYVVKEDPTSGDVAVTSKSKVGSIQALSDKNHEYIWFKYMGAGGLMASDKIKVSNIVSAVSRKSTAMDTPLKKWKITLDTNVQNLAGAQVVAGQDYILNLEFYQYIGLSDDTTYLKQAMVHGVANMTNDIFYKTLAFSLVQNLSRELEPLVKVYVHSTSTTSKGGFDAQGFREVDTSMKVVSAKDASNPYWDGSSAVAVVDYIVLQQVEQPWILGKMSASAIPFNIQFSTITVAGDEVIWGETKDITSEAKPEGKMTNGKTIADLEWFCMGERGDQYRGVGYPNNLETKYLVDPTHNYDTLDITYYYAGEGVDVQQSQKVLTLVADNAGSNAIMKNIVTRVNAATSNKPFPIAAPADR